MKISDFYCLEQSLNYRFKVVEMCGSSEPDNLIQHIARKVFLISSLLGPAVQCMEQSYLSSERDTGADSDCLGSETTGALIYQHRERKKSHHHQFCHTKEKPNTPSHTTVWAHLATIVFLSGNEKGIWTEFECASHRFCLTCFPVRVAERP